MNITQLQQMLAKKSLSEMEYDELLAHILSIRQSRMTTKATDKKLTEKEPKLSGKKSGSTRQPRQQKLPDLSKLSEAELTQLMKMLGA